MSTGNPELDLIAHVFRQALKDARAGHGDAITFLDDLFPEWQRFAGSTPKRSRTRETTHQGQNVHGKPVLSSGRLPVQSISTLF